MFASKALTCAFKHGHKLPSITGTKRTFKGYPRDIGSCLADFSKYGFTVVRILQLSEHVKLEQINAILKNTQTSTCFHSKDYVLQHILSTLFGNIDFESHKSYIKNPNVSPHSDTFFIEKRSKHLLGVWIPLEDKPNYNMHLVKGSHLWNDPNEIHSNASILENMAEHGSTVAKINITEGEALIWHPSIIHVKTTTEINSEQMCSQTLFFKKSVSFHNSIPIYKITYKAENY
jgi:ectoine hydroxylase-related dioxygenase (phytanoyl-CoA dioxygenase family)